MFPYQNYSVLDPKKCLKRQQILCQRIAMLDHFQADKPPPEKWWNQATMHCQFFHSELWPQFSWLGPGRVRGKENQACVCANQ